MEDIINRCRQLILCVYFYLVETDVDECALETDYCARLHTNGPRIASCANTIGGFVCRCHSGFTGNGVQCSG